MAVALMGWTSDLNSLTVMDCDFFFWNFTLHRQLIPELVSWFAFCVLVKRREFLLVL